MNRFIVTAAVFAIAFTMTTGTAHAQPQKKSIASNKSLTINNSLHLNKTIVNYNGCYRLRTYCGWTSSCYFPTYGCYAYFCPLDGLWYYWCDALHQYIPVTYLAVYRPVTTGYVVLQTGIPVTLAGVGAPALPAGAAALPAGGGALPGVGGTLPEASGALPPGAGAIRPMELAK